MSPTRYRRTDRVAALILREVTRIVREEVRDPRIGFVTFTGAEVSPDLASGRLFVSVMGTEAEKRDSITGLRSAAPFIRSQLWDVLDLKTVPELAFELDRTLERAARIDALLERALGEEQTGAGPGLGGEPVAGAGGSAPGEEDAPESGGPPSAEARPPRRS